MGRDITGERFCPCRNSTHELSTIRVGALFVGAAQRGGCGCCTRLCIHLATQRTRANESAATEEVSGLPSACQDCCANEPDPRKHTHTHTLAYRIFACTSKLQVETVSDRVSAQRGRLNAASAASAAPNRIHSWTPLDKKATKTNMEQGIVQTRCTHLWTRAKSPHQRAKGYQQNCAIRLAPSVLTSIFQFSQSDWLNVPMCLTQSLTDLTFAIFGPSEDKLNVNETHHRHNGPVRT